MSDHIWGNYKKVSNNLQLDYFRRSSIYRIRRHLNITLSMKLGQIKPSCNWGFSVNNNINIYSSVNYKVYFLHCNNKTTAEFLRWWRVFKSSEIFLILITNYRAFDTVAHLKERILNLRLLCTVLNFQWNWVNYELFESFACDMRLNIIWF